MGRAAKRKASDKAGKGIPAQLWAAFEKAHPERRNDSKTRALETLLGRTLPPDFRRYGYADSPNGSIFLPPVEELIAPGVNSFERVLERTDHGMPDALRQIFNSCYFLGEIEGDGDCFFAYVPAEIDAPSSLVTVWSHGEGIFTEPIAQDIASFELAWQVSTGARRAKKTDRALLARLRGRIHDRWPFNSEAFPGNAKLQNLFDDAPESSVRFLGARSSWIVRVLLHGKAMPAWAWPTQQLEFANLPKMLDAPSFPQRAATALYALWRTFFLCEDDKLALVIKRLEGTPSRLLADAVTTVRELLAGRKKLGPLDDVHAVRRWLAKTVKNPKAATAALADEARRGREGALAAAVATAGLTFERSSGAHLRIGIQDGKGEWPLPDGGRVVLARAGIRVRGKKSRTGVKAMPWPAQYITGVAVAPDGSHAVLAWGILAGMFEVPLPSGTPARLRWHGAADISYVADGALISANDPNLVVFERRRDQIIPVAFHETERSHAAVVLEGRVVVSHGGDGTMFYAVHDGVLVPMFELAIEIEGVAERDGNVCIELAPNEWYELRGVAKRWTASKPARPEPVIPKNFPVARISLDTEPSKADAKTFSGAITRLRRGGITFAVMSERKGDVLVWELDGKRMSVALPPLEENQDRQSLDVAVSPDQRRALVFHHDSSTVREVDLHAGTLGLERSDDPHSGVVNAVGFVTNDIYAWSHFQSHIQRFGTEDELLGNISDVYSSIAGIQLAKGKAALVAVRTASAYESQELHVLDLPRMKWRKPVPLGPHLVTVVRHGEDVVLATRDEVRRFVL